jgi:hypothetical protein
MKNSIKLIMLIISALLFMGCSIQKADHDFRFVGWLDGERELITNSINDWGSDIVIDDSSNNIIQKADKLPGFTMAQLEIIIKYNEESFKISYLDGLDEKRLRLGTRHEIGHLLCHINNLKDCDIHLGKGNVMAADYKDSVDYITEADFAYAFGD